MSTTELLGSLRQSIERIDDEQLQREIKDKISWLEREIVQCDRNDSVAFDYDPPA